MTRQTGRRPPLTDEEIRDYCKRFDTGDNEGDRIFASVLLALERLRASSGKTCSSCKAFLPLSDFWKDSMRADGLGHRCRACDYARKINPDSQRDV